ncbi:MAG: diaminopimelate epimerase [Candidatus Methanomethylophilaceae archaeon]
MIEFWKYHGIGNDFVVIDGTKADPGLTPEQIAFLCDRNFGIGSDGVIYVNPGMDGSDVTMRIFNTDGTEPEMCGNGVRCLAKHAYDFCIVKSPDFVIHTGKGNLGAHCTLGADGKVDSVRIDMGAPILDPPSVPVKGDGDRVIDRETEIAGVRVHINAVSMGNPHCVIFDDLSDADVERLGPIIEAGRELFPNKVNVEFAKVSDGRIDIRVFERGVGWTLACGTGACATTTAAALNGLVPFDEPVPVHLPGGDLRITVSGKLDRILMDGPARLVYRGEIEL